jgi:hypothetical protein
VIAVVPLIHVQRVRETQARMARVDLPVSSCSPLAVECERTLGPSHAQIDGAECVDGIFGAGSVRFCAAWQTELIDA